MSFFVWFDPLRPGNNFSVMLCLPGLNQYKAKINVPCSKTQHSEAGETQTRCPSVSIQALYHWAIVHNDIQYHKD